MCQSTRSYKDALGLSWGVFFVCALLFLLVSCDNVAQSPEKKAEHYSRLSQELYQKAIKEYQRAFAKSPHPQELLFELGRLYFQHADYEKALGVLGPLDSVAATRLMAFCYYELGQYTDALTIFNKLGDTGDEEYFYYYALTCEQQNLYDQALKIYERIKSSGYRARVAERVGRISALAKKTTVQNLDPRIQQVINKSPASDQYPQAGAVILLADEDMVVNEDNTTEYVQHFLIKVLNERGKHLGEIEVGYDSTYEKVDIDFARTIKPDGEVVSAGAKHIRDVSRYLNFPLYSNARVRIISMPEVSSGAFIEYQIRLKRGKMVSNDKFFTQYMLQSNEPIQQARFTVQLPRGRVLHQKILNAEFNPAHIHLEPIVARQGRRDVYTWEFKDIPQIIPEPGMPPLAEITPVILLSTFDGWPEIYQWWWELAQDKIEATPEIKKKVEALTAGKTTLREKVQAIYNFCARDIRYVAIEYGLAGYEPHKAGEIFANKYGDCKDKTILLITMLREIGVIDLPSINQKEKVNNAYPVLIGTKGLIPTQNDFPTLSFNHCITAVDMDGELIFVDPTAEAVLFGDLPGGDQGRRVFVFYDDRGELKSTPVFPAENNQALTTTKFHFDEQENITATRTVRTLGTFDQAQRYRLRYTMPLLIEEGIKERIQALIPASRLLDYEVKNLENMVEEIELSYRFTGSDFLIMSGEGLRVVPQLARVDLTLASKDRRQYPIDFNIPSIDEDVLEIQLPKHYRVKSLPTPIVQETPWFDYAATYDYHEDTLIYKEKTTNKGIRLETKDYASYKSILEKLSKDVRYCVILETVRAGETTKKNGPKR